MTRLQDLFGQCGQSPWLDTLSRDALHDGSLQALIERGVRGVTSNPSIFEKAISGSALYDDDIASHKVAGASVDDAYWALVMDDIQAAADLLRPLYDESAGVDGYVSVEIDPRLADETAASVDGGKALFARADRPNVMIKVPATAAGIPVIEELLANGINVNVTLIFSLERYDEVLGAWRRGLERAIADGLTAPHSVGSFFVSRVDTEVDKRLEEIGSDDARALRGNVAVAQARVAYDNFAAFVAGDAPRPVQRPLWASTSTKNPEYPELLYVDTLIGPDTVNTLPEPTLEGFDARGTVARTVDADVAGARGILDQVAAVGVDMDDVAQVLEREGVKAFADAHEKLLAALGPKLKAPIDSVPTA
ncbi:MAG: transaldolase [Acidimicrobiales bacterium]|nr:transaldolase [Acidimicrobiales bacterium]